MTNAEISKWLANLKNDIGQSQYQPLWHYAEALDKAIEALEEQKWIPCDKGKPDPYRRVLMTERRPDWDGKEYRIVTLNSFCNYRGDVVAWMLPPEPFKEDEG